MVIGDGVGQPMVIAGDKLNDYEALQQIGSSFLYSKIRPVSESKDVLEKKTFLTY